MLVCLDEGRISPDSSSSSDLGVRNPEACASSCDTLLFLPLRQDPSLKRLRSSSNSIPGTDKWCVPDTDVQITPRSSMCPGI